ncbi:hypothetical protein AFK68_17990 [Hydrocoleum sp. CS-953]|uniref:hypothetical protein n=1 Tax=Hydrocoleum sp. CS-953 TaxID=1671698 RepID=UPI000B9A5FB5|nr:hypothetical protein [Hydrocoleum sp. CS-953]OZH53380.1 hypothetical protein AFK68_17990 [Hydrocoleum sp. CS-953]
MKNHLIKIASVAVGTILTYSTINLNSARAINNLSEFFLTAQTTKIPIKIEPNYVIDDVIQGNSKVTNEAIVVTQTLNKLPEKSNLEYKFLHANRQTKFVKAKVGNWQYNLEKKSSQLPIDPGIVLGVGLISLGRLCSKKRP